MRQCLLSLKVAWDSNKGEEVYVSVTTGEHWQMIRYDGVFQVTENIGLLFYTMSEDTERWMNGLVDCLYISLSDGSIVTKDMAVG